MKLQIVDEGQGWGLNSEDYYVEFPKQDETGIAITAWGHKISVQPHRHKYHEFALITKGSCIHDYKGAKVSVVPGDLLFIEPNEYHGYEIETECELINCQFYPEKLRKECNEALDRTKKSIVQDAREKELEKQWTELIRELFEQENGKDLLKEEEVQEEKLKRQGIIHLTPEIRKEMEFLLNKMMAEQDEIRDDSENVKSACLQLLLIMIQREYDDNFEKRNTIKDFRKDAIYKSIAYMESHLDEKLEIEKLAANVFWSPQRFRKIFKEVTGLTPIEYLNRIRIVKALEYMKNNKCTIADAAASVGIYDTNYFSRLFKKVLGYSPKHFKKI